MSNDIDAGFQKNADRIRSSFKRLFEALMQQTADRIYIKDTQSRFVFVSDALARTHGHKDRSELEGMSDFDFFDEATAEAFYAEEQQILNTRQPIINRTVKETWKHGRTTWASESKVPLYSDSKEIIGILGISRDVTEEHLRKEQLRQANKTMLADYASAEKVQQVMIPGRIPELPDINIGYVWKPMSAVGGDIINFPRNPENKMLFFLGDVCGHGVQAAFYTVLLKYITAQVAVSYNDSPTDLLNTVNSHISRHIKGGFITSIAGHIECSSDNDRRTLFVAHAGHPQMHILRAETQQIEAVQLPTALVMGLPGGTASETVSIDLQPGDRIYTYTDGVIEAENQHGQEFGIAQLEQALVDSAELPVQIGLDLLFSKVSEFTKHSGQQDDIALLGLEVK